ncbi:sulfatase-like hydrolase/transferase [Vallitaleaceae bacterium 9-2]
MQTYPNILWIFSDQHRAQAMSCAGDSNILTVNMDRLANSGVRFNNAFSNTPICSPSRGCVYTGKYATRHGAFCLHVPPKPNQRLLQEELKVLGYYTSHYGKWHLSGGAAPSHFVSSYFRPGWDEWKAWENSNMPWETEYSEGDFPLPIRTLIGYQTDALTDMTIEFIRKQSNTECPWFHVMSVEPPHEPHTPPNKYIEQFQNIEFEIRKNVPKKYFDNPKNKEKLIGYYGQIKNLDDNIGRILDALRKTRQIDNTIIFYFSDHGEMLGSHNLSGKSTFYVEASKIPLIISYPKKVPQGIVTNENISTIDFFPTLLGMIGADIPKDIEGIDCSEYIFGNKEKLNQEVLIQFERRFYGVPEPDRIFRAIVEGDYMYVYFLNETKKLYNIHEDELQLNNLANSKKELVNRLHQRLMLKLESIGDHFFQRKIEEERDEAKD